MVKQLTGLSQVRKTRSTLAKLEAVPAAGEAAHKGLCAVQRIQSYKCCVLCSVVYEKSLPAQGTKFWALMRVWEDGTHEFVVPAVKDVIGAGPTYHSALQDVEHKLATMVEETFEEGFPVSVLDRGQSVFQMRGDMDSIAEGCREIDMAVPKLKKTQMRTVKLDYKLIHS